MPSLKDLYKEATKGSPLHITREHSRWIEMPEDERFQLIRDNREVVQFVLEKAVFGAGKEERTGRISASGLGGCLRRSLFGYANAPRLEDDPDSIDLMSMGTHDHLWWQIEGMVMGWLNDVEPFVYDGNLVGGSLDGTGKVDQVPIFELKTVRESKYTKIVQVDQMPVFEHEIQWDFYAEQLEVDSGALVYQERGGGAYHEFWLERRPEVADRRQAITEQLGNHIADNTLPEMLSDCEMKQGWAYRQCPFRKYCPKAHTVTT